MILTLVALALNPQTNTVRFIGRFSHENGGMACEWPGSAVQFATNSNSATVRMKASTDGDRWQVDVDGRQTEILKLNPKVEDYTIHLPDKNSHMVTLVRRTETFTGKTTWLGTKDAAPQGPFVPRRKILIVGDSISAGYGVDGAKKEEHYSVETSNAYMTYGWVAARLTHADPTIVAWSGRKMYPDNTMPEIFDYVLPNEKQGTAADDPKTQAILINLATNDFGKEIPNEFKWTGAYRAFVLKLRSKFPSAHIYLATGSMMSDNYPPNVKALSTVKGYLNSIVSFLKDPKVHRIDFAVQDEKDGIGSDWHPNKVTQAKMGKHFAEALHKDLSW